MTRGLSWATARAISTCWRSAGPSEPIRDFGSRGKPSFSSKARASFPSFALSRMPCLDGILDNAKEGNDARSEEHTSELQSRVDLVCRLLLEKKKKTHRQ